MHNKYQKVITISLRKIHCLRGGKSLLQKLLIQLPSQLACAGRGGGSAGEGGGGRGVAGVGSSCSGCVQKVPVTRVWLVGAELS